MPLPVQGLHGAHQRSDLVSQLGERRVQAAVRGGEVVPLWTGVVVEAPRLLDPLTRAAAAQFDGGPARRAVRRHGRPPAWMRARRLSRRPRRRTVRPRRREAGAGSWHTTAVSSPKMSRRSAASTCSRSIVDRRPVVPLRRRGRAATPSPSSTRPSDGDPSTNIPQGRGRPAGAAAGNRAPFGHAACSISGPSGRVAARELAAAHPHRARLPAARGQLDHHSPPMAASSSGWTSRGRQLRICVEYDGWEAHAGREVEHAALAADARPRHGWIVIRVAVGDQRSIGELLSALRAAFAKRGYTW